MGVSQRAEGTLAVQNPATGEVVGSAPVEPPDTVAETVRRLRSHQPAWEALGPHARAGWLRRLRDWVLDHEAHLIGVIQAETGKPRAEAVLEVALVCDVVNYYGDRAAGFLADERARPHSLLTVQKSQRTSYRPYPVVGVIAPWNFPLLIPGADLVPALLAGAGAVLKPSELTPLSGLELIRGWQEIGAPRVLAAATGGTETGQAVVDNVDMVQFTGSTATGRAVAARAGERLIPCSVELGGKDPAIVLADADLTRAANGIAWGAIAGAGQICVSVERVYVEAPVYERFLTLLVERVKAVRHERDLGPLADDRQLGVVRHQVEDAVARGATVVTGGSPGPGTYFPPTVLTGVDHSMACMREESFGPLIPVMRVSDEDEAVRLANDSGYGLSATVWTGDRKRGAEIARRLEAGAVNVNDALSNLFCFGLPHGGWKNSGLGSRLGGQAGIRKYCRPQAVTAPWLPTLPSELIWFPYSATRGRVVEGLLRLLVARDLPRRLGRGVSR